MIKTNLNQQQFTNTIIKSLWKYPVNQIERLKKCLKHSSIVSTCITVINVAYITLGYYMLIFGTISYFRVIYVIMGYLGVQEVTKS